MASCAWMRTENSQPHPRRRATHWPVSRTDSGAGSDVSIKRRTRAFPRRNRALRISVPMSQTPRNSHALGHGRGIVRAGGVAAGVGWPTNSWAGASRSIGLSDGDGTVGLIDAIEARAGVSIFISKRGATKTRAGHVSNAKATPRHSQTCQPGLGRRKAISSNHAAARTKVSFNPKRSHGENVSNLDMALVSVLPRPKGEGRGENSPNPHLVLWSLEPSFVGANC